jgi:hypothetical protein
MLQQQQYIGNIVTRLENLQAARIYDAIIDQLNLSFLPQ